jgi:outer membrane protein
MSLPRMLCTFFLYLVGACLIWGAPVHADRLTLPEGLKAVTAENRLIKIKQQDALISEADTLVARASLLPRIDGSFTRNYTSEQPGVRLGPSAAANTAEQTFYTYSLTLQQILFDFKGIYSQYEASRRILETKQLDTRRTRNYVALQFSLAYFDLLESEKMVVVSDREKERLEAHLKTAKDLYAEGVITKNDLLQAEVRLSDATQRFLTAGNRRRINVSRLNNLLVRPLSSSLEVEDPGREEVEAIPLETVFQKAETDRYEVKIVDTTFQALNLQETARKAEYLPRFFFQGGYNFSENKYLLEEGMWSGILGMQINLFGGGSTKAQLSKLSYQKMKLIMERKQLLDDIRLEAERYYLELVNAQDRVGVTKEATVQAEENLRINRVKYKEGVGTATDVIDAITLLSVAETNYYRSRYELSRAEAGLMYAMGKDLVEVYK